MGKDIGHGELNTRVTAARREEAVFMSGNSYRMPDTMLVVVL